MKHRHAHPGLLDPQPARKLTSRECAKLFGGVIGSLMSMTDAETVRGAVRWWADNDAGWNAMEAHGKWALEAGAQIIAKQLGIDPETGLPISQEKQ